MLSTHKVEVLKTLMKNSEPLLQYLCNFKLMFLGISHFFSQLLQKISLTFFNNMLAITLCLNDVSKNL